MIPLGVLAQRQGGAQAAPLEWLSSSAADALWSKSTALTAMTVDLGSAGDNLYVVVALRADTGASITSVTVGGNIATLDYQNAMSNNVFVFCSVTSPGGTGDILAVKSQHAVYRQMCGVWRGPSATFSAASTGTNSASLTAPAGGFTIVGNYNNANTAVAFTGATERFDQQIGTATSRWAGADTTDSGSLTITSTSASSPGIAAAAYAIGA